MKKKYYVSMTSDFTKDIVYISDIKYALMKIRDDYYICAYKPELKADADGIYFENWQQGHYFSNRNDAVLYIKKLLDKIIYDYIDEISYMRGTIDEMYKWDIDDYLPFK